MLETVDLSASLSREEFDRQKEATQNALRQAQLLAWKHNLGVLVVFEGWSYSGRASCARLLAESTDPRGLRVHVVYPPTREERRYPFARRYWSLLPARGDLAVFVRSWYWHLLDDQVRRRRPPLRQSEVIEQVRDFERMLAEDRYLIVKFWLHIDGKEQRRRRKKYGKGRKWLARKLPDDPKQHKRRKRYTDAAEAMLSGTDTDFGRWHVIPANDERFARMAVASILTRRIGEEVARLEQQPAPPPAPVAAPLPDMMGQANAGLNSADLSSALEDEAYGDRLIKAQERLSELMYDCVDAKRSVVLVFEGWDAGGKGGVIRRLTAELDPRYYQVHPIAAPQGDEKERHYLWRFWERVPPEGHWALFDRSWYGRVLVERVEGFAAEADWRRAYDEIRHFERDLFEYGAIVLKFWLHVSSDEQLRRFQERQQVEFKNYKITDEDWRNREKRPDYEAAVEEMLLRTSVPFAPWVVVPGNDKNFARVTALEAVEKHVREGLKRKQSHLRASF